MALLLVIAGGAAAFVWALPELRRMMTEPGDTASALPGAGAARGDAQAPLRPVERVAAGESYEVRVFQEPVPSYGPAEPTDDDGYFADIARRVGGARYDPALGFVAREVAMYHVDAKRSPPGEALAFWVESAGAACWGSRQVIISTTRQGAEPVERALEEALASVVDSDGGGVGALHVGLGESIELSEPPTRHVAVVVSRCGVELARVPREVDPGGRVRIAGRVDGSARTLQVISMGPDLEVREVEAAFDGRHFEASVPAGPARGVLEVELIATRGRGPEVLAQLRFRVGGPLPDAIDVVEAPDESSIETAADAESFMFDLVTLDRRDYGLDDLVRDGRLDRVAREHSREMRDRQYFAHTSPWTGTLADRLAGAGIETATSGENIARHSSVYGAERGLMRSIGHRRNILARGVDRVGIGVVAEHGDGPRQWYFTQVFAKLVERVDAGRFRGAVLDRLASARAAKGAAALRADPDLQTLAQREAERYGAANPSDLLATRSDAMRGRTWGWVAALPTPDVDVLPEQAADPDFRRIGVGVAQDWNGDKRIYLVILLSQ